MKFLRLPLTLTLLFSIIFTSTVNANTFRDVPANHFALEAIRWVSNPANGSYMVGDASNNFNPSRVMDSFETAITFAMAAGFRYSLASITPAEQAMFDRAYERHRPVLASMATQHPSWRRTADREIAFLLELEILTQDDLAHFMVRGAGGTETAASLTKEVASAFILRLYGSNDFTEPNFTFRDNAEISPMYRRYAYLAHQLGVVTDYDGDFSPQRGVTRAELAQMFHTLRIAAPGTPGAITTNQTAQEVTPFAPNTESSGSSPFSSTFHGTITDVQQDNIQITTEYGAGIHTFGANPIIVVDNVRREISDLAPGMLAAVGLDADGRIISMLVRTGTGTPVPTPDNAEQTTPPFAIMNEPVPPLNVNIQGYLTNRRFTNAAPVLIVEERAGNIHDLAVAADTYITRNGVAGDWAALRIGDQITARVEFNRLVSIQAEGSYSSNQGILEEIHITQNLDSIVIRQADDTPIRFALPPEIYNIYDLRLGMELFVHADSREIYDLEVLDNTAVQNQDGTGFIGHVQSLRHGHTMVITYNDGDRHTIRVDGNTMNTATNETLNFRDIRTQMRLYIVMQPDSDIAQSITILP